MCDSCGYCEVVRSSVRSSEAARGRACAILSLEAPVTESLRRVSAELC